MAGFVPTVVLARMTLSSEMYEPAFVSKPMFLLAKVIVYRKYAEKLKFLSKHTIAGVRSMAE